MLSTYLKYFRRYVGIYVSYTVRQVYYASLPNQTQKLPFSYAYNPETKSLDSKSSRIR